MDACKKLKAYKVWVDNSDKGCGIVWAENAGKARQQAISTDACEDERYIDIRAKRLPGLDHIEKCACPDNPWLDEDIRLILVRDYGWYCNEPEYSDCDKCIAKQYCSVIEDRQ